jgi:hypothetical protein
MGNGKGKGRASVVEDAANQLTAEQSSQAQDSVLRRVVASAAILSLSTLAPPCSKEITGHASAVLGSSGKDQRVGGSVGSACAEGSRPPLRDLDSFPHGGSCQTFTDDTREQHIQNSEAEFSSFLDGVNPFTPTPDTAKKWPPMESEPPEDFVGVSSVGGYAESKLKEESTCTALEKQQQNDGEAVLAILSHPGLATDSLVTFQGEAAFDWPLSPERKSALLADIKEHGRFFDRLPGTVSNAGPFTSFIDNIGEESFFYFGRRIEQEEAQQAWMGEWGEVLTHYTDEVWGDLLPLVKEAREEFEAMKGTTMGQQPPKALRRLGLILSHLREP